MDKVEKGILGVMVVFGAVVIFCCVIAVRGIKDLSQLIEQEGVKGIVEEVWEGDK